MNNAIYLCSAHVFYAVPHLGHPDQKILVAPLLYADLTWEYLSDFTSRKTDGVNLIRLHFCLQNAIIQVSRLTAQ